MRRPRPPKPPPSGSGSGGVLAPGLPPPGGASEPLPAVPGQPSGGSRVCEDESDEVLAQRAARGDEEAFAELLDRYERVVFNLALRMIGNRDDAADLTQDVFLKVWKGLSGFDPSLRFFSWIYRIGIRVCLNHRRGAARQQELEIEPETTEAGPEARAEASELEARVHEALGRLPKGDREVLVLRHFLDRSYEEIGEILKVPSARVKSRLYEARQRLRRELEKRGMAS